MSNMQADTTGLHVGIQNRMKQRPLLVVSASASKSVENLQAERGLIL